jgi:hypothetical protein
VGRRQLQVQNGAAAGAVGQPVGGVPAEGAPPARLRQRHGGVDRVWGAAGLEAARLGVLRAAAVPNLDQGLPHAAAACCGDEHLAADDDLHAALHGAVAECKPGVGLIIGDLEDLLVIRYTGGFSGVGSQVPSWAAPDLLDYIVPSSAHLQRAACGNAEARAWRSDACRASPVPKSAWRGCIMSAWQRPPASSARGPCAMAVGVLGCERACTGGGTC